MISTTTRALLAAGVDINIRSQQDEPAAPASPEAPGTGRSVSGAATTAVGPRGPGYQATLSAGSTPLLVATVRGHVPLALFLLEQGADPNVLDAGFTPLHWASADVGRRHLESGVRLQGCHERHSQPSAEDATREGTARKGRESERAHDTPAAWILRTGWWLRRRPRSHTVPAGGARPRTSR